MNIQIICIQTNGMVLEGATAMTHSVTRYVWIDIAKPGAVCGMITLRLYLCFPGNERRAHHVVLGHTAVNYGCC